MASEELLRNWAISESHLEAAYALLPLEAHADLEQYRVFIDHNEHGLALDELMAVGAERKADAAFWLELTKAADNMGRSGEADTCRAHGQTKSNQ